VLTGQSPSSWNTLNRPPPTCPKRFDRPHHPYQFFFFFNLPILNLGLPQSTPPIFFSALHLGLRRCTRYGCSLCFLFDTPLQPPKPSFREIFMSPIQGKDQSEHPVTFTPPLPPVLLPPLGRRHLIVFKSILFGPQLLSFLFSFSPAL